MKKNNKRRTIMAAPILILLSSIFNSFAGNKNDARDQDLHLKNKFQGIYGAEIVVDATFFTNDVIIINTDTDTDLLFNIGSGKFNPNGRKYSSYGMTQSGDRLAIPKNLRYLHFPPNAEFINLHKAPYFKESPTTDVTVPVAERIPEEILALVRDEKKSLRIKLRLHPKTLLIGWDLIEKPQAIVINGNKLFTPPKYSHAGGDFQEAKIQNGKIIQKGWYIDPETRERVETDF